MSRAARPGDDATNNALYTNGVHGSQEDLREKGYEYCISSSCHYRMDSQPKGKCLIINNKCFEDSMAAGVCDSALEKLTDREGTDVDRDKLITTFSRLGFDVEVRNNQTSSAMMHVMQDLSRLDHGRYDGFLACFLSHGCQGMVFGTDAVAVHLKDLMTPVKPSSCRTLCGKPKIFFVQACQGKDVQKGHKNMARDSNPNVDDLIPDDADFLLGYCTVPGSAAYRDPKKGSPYISILTDLIDKYADSKDLLEILTLVNQAVGQQHMRVEGEPVKQIPSPSYTLQKKLFLDTSKLPTAASGPGEEDSEVYDSISLRDEKAAMPSQAVERDAPPRLGRRMQSFVKAQIYTVSVFTSQGVPGAGTDANVSMVIFGTAGQSGEIKLAASETHKDPFEKGHTDLFTVTEDSNLGDLHMIRIWHDNKGRKAAWHLAKVEVQDKTTLKTYIFPCGQWLSKSKGDKLTERDLKCADVLCFRKYNDTFHKRTDYKIIARTSDVRGAGTDANVYVILIGEKGESDELRLKKSELHRDPFERGNTDIFKFTEVRCLDTLRKLRVWHDNKGAGAAWHLASIEVEDLSSQQHFFFPCGQWLSTNEGDKRILRELTCVNPAQTSSHLANMTDYRFRVKTSADVLGAGTDANVFVILYGSKSESRQLALKESETHKDPFETGQLDAFTVRALPHLGELRALRVWHDNKGRGAAWHLAYIEVDDLKENKTYTFHCGRWLSKKDEDKQIERCLQNPSVRDMS